MNQRTFRDREVLQAARQQGGLATGLAFVRLSGPGWLQSAITLGGGSLLGALYLGMLGGTSMLWLQLVAITIGVIMLSAISYVTLSTNVRPYRAINDYVNPVLGVGWVTATILANMIWVIPQFALCYDSLDKSLLSHPLDAVTRAELAEELSTINGKLSVPASDSPAEASTEMETRKQEIQSQLNRADNGLGTGIKTKLWTSLAIAVAALMIVLLSFNPGWMAKLFDVILKLIVAMIVVCFVAVVVYLTRSGSLDWPQILMGFIPDFRQWTSPVSDIQSLLAGLDGANSQFWESQIVSKQRESMIGVTATAVGLNMTFLLPYSMLARGWDKTFRGLARFDLVTAMAIPYLLVTTCIVIASAHAFHAKADPAYLSSDPTVMQQSVLFDSTLDLLEKRYLNDAPTEPERAQMELVLNGDVNRLQDQLAGVDQADSAVIQAQLESAKAIRKQTLATFAAGLGEAEKRIVPTLVKPNASQLAATLKPLLGEGNQRYADLIFGLGALGMGFSTIIILSLINGYAVAEIVGKYEAFWPRLVGALAAIGIGVCWFWIWEGESRTWLSIVASTFGAILLPIAYISFFALMNSYRLLGAEKPTGVRMIIWNVLMLMGVVGALLQAYGGIRTRIADPETGAFVIGGVAVFVLLAVVGFSATRKTPPDSGPADLRG